MSLLDQLFVYHPEPWQVRYLYQAGLSVFLFDYRGYGRSQNLWPTESGLYQDALGAYDYLTRTRMIRPERIVLFGRSFGAPLLFPAPSPFATIDSWYRVRSNCGTFSAVAGSDKLLSRILHGTSDANIHFDELCQLLRRIGFEERIRGSHHVFRRQGVQELINLQRDGNKAKIYQVRQVRAVILKYRLGGEADV